jgi:putative SbcD/Mre11-related phosphoesterase
MMLEPIKNYPALLHTEKQHKTLIIADLHLGWEINLAKKGIHIPSQTTKILQRLLRVISIANPKTLIILGDVKHTIAKAEPGEWKDIPEFFEAISAEISDVRVIRGNHDGTLEPLLPKSVELYPSTGTALDGVGLFHGHTWPAKKLLNSKILVMGHVHPTLSIRDALGFRITTPVWIKIGLDSKKLETPYLKDKHAETTTPRDSNGKRTGKPEAKQLLIIPCFNDFLGGRPINRKDENKGYIGPLLRSEATNIEKGQVYLLDGTFLGTVEQLRGLS